MQIQKDLKSRIQEILQKHNIKQVDLAREIGIHHSTLSLWMQNKNKPRKQDISNSQSTRIEELLERWIATFHANKGQGMGTGQFRLPDSRASQFLSHHTVRPVLPISKFHILRNQYQNSIKQQRQEIILRKTQEQLKNNPNISLQQALNQSAQDIPIEPPKHQQLVPITIDFELDGKKIYQTFCWNLNESHMIPETFARIITEENQLPSVIEQEICTQIKKQVQNYKCYYPTKNEMLKNLHVDLRVENIHFKDQLEWDMNNTMNSPEALAEVTAKEMGMPEQYEPKIAHALRESISSLQRQMEPKTGEDYSNLKKSTRTLIESTTNYNQFKNVMFSNQINDKNWVRCELEYDHQFQWGPQIELLDSNALRNVQKQEDRKTRYVRRLR
ncbi:unnamed protein product [Paramecium sonneborni]|uniref:HTH cro/C1-type domain-containing protein n=1 Tax=Paramecium sonneborni TaxID=65129 RepID=A0A8S1NRX0_9CILI|nr:unnamed protein product [Paramecium sonneborni]